MFSCSEMFLYFFHRIEERCPSIEEAVDVMEATGVEVVDGEGDVDVCLQGNLQGVRSDLPLGIGEVVCDLPAKEEMYIVGITKTLPK